MQQDDLYEKELERMSKNMERRIKRLERDFWVHKETRLRSYKANVLDGKSKKIQQLDLFAG